MFEHCCNNAVKSYFIIFLNIIGSLHNLINAFRVIFIFFNGATTEEK